MTAGPHRSTSIGVAARVLAVASALALAGCGSSGAPVASSTAAPPATSPVTPATGTPPASIAASPPPASTGPASLAPFLVVKGDILFNDLSTEEVDAIAPDGTNRRQLTNVPGLDWMATLSPDGRRIAWSSDPGNGRDIYVMNADGSSVQRLTGNDFHSYHPSWAPSNDHLVFGAAETQELFEIAADGSGEVRISAKMDSHPEWSPDGKHIVFMRGPEEGHDIYVADADGSNARRLTTDPKDDQIPVWSPDGRLIAFTRGSGDERDIWVMNADGSNQKALKTNRLSGGPSYWPSYSRDGSSIAFTRDASATSPDVWIMNADGTNPRPLTTTGHDWGPRWG